MKKSCKPCFKVPEMINTHTCLFTGLAHFLQGSAKMLVAELPRCWRQSCLDVGDREKED